MRNPRSSFRFLLSPILVGLGALALASCESAQPLSVERPSFAPGDPLFSRKSDSLKTRSITLTAPDSSLVTGQKVQATAIPLQYQKSPNGFPVTFAISPASVASISSTGLITAIGSGAATVSASTTDGVTQTMPITVSSGTLAAAVALSASTSTLILGQSTQVSGLVMYPRGSVMSGSPIVWSVSPATVATISSTGVVKAIGVGTATVTGMADTASARLTFTMTDSAAAPGGTPTTPVPPTPPVPGGGSGGSYGSATAAELPRLSVVTTYPSMSRQVHVAANANLQQAINAAQPGDELLLAPGATYVGNFTLPNKGSSNSWVVIRTDLPDAVIGNPGTRMTPTRAGSARLAKIQSNTINSALITNLGANHYRLTGLELGVTSKVTDLNAIIRFGESSYAQNTVPSIAHDIVLDRSYVHGGNSVNTTRCLMLNSATTAIVDSWFGDCHSNNGDSQAIIGWNGPGPFLIENNHLEAGHEVVAFGGSTATIVNQSPSDITFRGNHVMRPLSWKGRWQVKNLLETKHVRRLLVEGNVFENNWADAQAGFAFVIKSENQNNDNPWTTSSDITIRFNKIRNSGNGINLAANPSGMPAIPAARIVITDNVMENINVAPYIGDGHTLQLIGGLSDIVMMHNTVVSAAGGGAYTVVFAQLPAVQKLVIHSNVLHHGVYGMKGAGMTEGTKSINYFAPGALVTNNAIANGGGTGIYPANNWFPATLANLGFTNWLGGLFRLSPLSGYLNKGYDGRDIGADIAQVDAKTQAAVVAP